MDYYKMLSNPTGILVLLCLCGLAASQQQQQQGDQPFRFQPSQFPASTSFQHINFFGPLSPQQLQPPANSAANSNSGTSGPQQSFFFGPQQQQQSESSQQRNPFFNQPVGNTATTTTTSPRPPPPPPPQFTFFTPAQQQSQPQPQRNAFGQRNPFDRPQPPPPTSLSTPFPKLSDSLLQNMPVPLALRPTTAPTSPPTTTPPPPSPETDEFSLAFQKVQQQQRPIQSLDESQPDDSRDGRQLRNRLRAGGNAGEQSGRRIPPVRPGANSDADGPSAAVRGRNRFIVATTTESEPVTTFRPRPTQLVRNGGGRGTTTTTTSTSTNRPEASLEETAAAADDVDEAEQPAAAVGDMAKSPPPAVDRVRQTVVRRPVPQAVQPESILPSRRRPGRPDEGNSERAPDVPQQVDTAAVNTASVSEEQVDDEEEVEKEQIAIDGEEEKELLSSQEEDEDILVEDDGGENSSKNNPSSSNGGGAKLEILGSSNNTSVVNLSNVVFVPNLDGLQLPPRPTTPTPSAVSSVATSRSVTTVKMSSSEPLGSTTTTTTTTTEATVSSDRQSKAIDARPSDQNKAPINIKEAELVPPTTGQTPTTIAAAESSIDELDRFQSELSSKHLTNSFTNTPDEVKPSPPPPPPPPPPPAVTTRKPFERPRRPFEAIGPPRLASTTTTSTSTERITVEESTNQEADEPSVAVQTDSTATTSKEQSLFDRLFGKLVIKDDISALLPPDFAVSSTTPQEEEKVPVGPIDTFLSSIKPELPADQPTETQQTTQPSPPLPSIPVVEVSMDSLAGLLPPGFNMPIVEDPLAGLLPPGFKMDAAAAPVETTTTTTTEVPKKTGIESIFDTVVFDDISGLLPPSFKHHLFTPSPSKSMTPTTPPSVSSETSVVTPSGPGDQETTTARKGLVFPTRAAPARNATTEKPRAKPTPVPVEIKSGWPIRATTEFTGWPSPPTTPWTPPPSTTPKVTTTTTRATTTTTTTTRAPTTPGVCGDECRLAGTIRLTDGIDWVPELQDHNTREWYQLAAIVEQHLDEAYQNGPLAPWYASIKVEAFSRGSVLVDYYLTLNGTNDMDTGEVRNYFHMSLDKDGEELKLGNFTVDPKSTDFIVLRRPIFSEDREKVVVGGVSEWIIAVVVVGLASLVFVIAFGTTMLIRRRRQNQRKSVPLTEEMLNELNKNHMTGGVDNNGADSFYDLGDAWDRPNFPVKPIKPLPRPASVSAIRTNASSSSLGSAFNNYSNFRPPPPPPSSSTTREYSNHHHPHHSLSSSHQQHDSWNKSEWDTSSYYDHHSNHSSIQRAKIAPRPATSYGRYPTYLSRQRPSYRDDF